MNMKKVLVAAVTLAAMLMASVAQADKVIKLGYTLPLTGSHAQYGELFRNSAKMQLEEFNKSGKLKGATVEIQFEDSKSDPKEAINIARKFVDDEQIVGVLGDFTSTVSMACGRVYAMEGMPQLSQTASHPDFTKVGKYQFRNITTQAFEGPFVAKWAKSLDFSKFAIIAIQNDWGISAAENFAEAIKGLGGEVTGIEYFNPGNRDFRSILTKVVREKPQAIYLCMMYEEGAMVLQQRHQLGIDVPVFGTSSLYSPKLLELAGDAANGMYLSTTFMPDSPEEHVVHFVTEYEKRYNSAPSMFAAQAYDAVGIMLDAVAKVGPEVTRDSLRDALAATKDYPGVTGSTTFDPETREPVKGLARMQVVNGAYKLVK
ncbi:ABC transporter substrate-binding protein [Pseudodesulfovibrio cashew]|uniref:ABC transporter substrate-binding protein n=1 Tax=Pseudodesulfovibrio cashew TaxID=2678688 RepID=A0A6I6JHD8_9BACT|nr:ABC transporter substrate-binding protein [Pseudodesulfovibrio cashew]QGY40440.1 ABC transporter substrate-binding protein [Pseudodesulfovibrio cashew]